MSVGADLVLLAVDAKHGRVQRGAFVALALAATELVELALAECVGLRGGQLIVLGRDGVTDPDLLSALQRISASKRRVTVEAWMLARGEGGRVRDRLLAWEDAGVVEVDDPTKSLAGDDALVVRILDEGPVLAAAERFAGAARGTLTGVEDEVLAALANAAGLTRAHLGAFSNRRARARIATLTEKRAETPPEPDRTVLAITRAAVLAMADIAARAGRNASSGPSNETRFNSDLLYGLDASGF